MSSKYPTFNWDASNLGEQITLFRQRMELALLDNGVDKLAKAAIKVKIAIGEEGLCRLNSWV